MLRRISLVTIERLNSQLIALPLIEKIDGGDSRQGYHNRERSSGEA
ncbi:hypothetical protein ID850_03490 [Xenorhabdus sp. Flor]|nr:hypothetical protein [Xenorhabdus sp. Flor]MBD2813840.1 hypothetical protein [Xenorhabdus sp. Flor]